MTLPESGVLDNPIWSALTGPHAHFAEGTGAARRYGREVSPFCAFAEAMDGAYQGLAALLAPGEVAPLFRPQPEPPRPGWNVVYGASVLQMVCWTPDRLLPARGEVVTLGEADVPDMLALVTLTRPGPFGPRTPALGRYIGVRDGGQLVAMAGERLHPAGFVEVSAVCTHPEYRGRGLAGGLTAEVARGIFARGVTPFLHVMPDNVGARRVYEALGFVVRAEIALSVLQPVGV